MIPSNQNNSINNQESSIEQILVYAKTFRRHSVLLHGKKQISPYDLACNGFVNKHFKEQQKSSSFEENIKQVSCICRIPQCSKNLKFNLFDHQNYQNQDDQDEIQSLMTEHEQNCQFYKKYFKKLTISQLFSISRIFFQKIHETHLKHQYNPTQNIQFEWHQLQKLILAQSNGKKNGFQSQGKITTNILLECYKNVDTKFNLLTKRCTKSILFSLFGWRFHPSKQNQQLIIMKCHFCGKKSQNLNQQSFDFYYSHNSWCLVRDTKYQIWKLMLKKLYALPVKNATQVQQQNSKQRQINTYILPKTQAQIQSKQIRYEIYELARPTLQKIDQLLERSLQFVKKQRKLNAQNDSGKNNSKPLNQIIPRQCQLNQGIPSEEHFKQIIRSGQQNLDTQPHLAKFVNLDAISKKCQEIIKNFINDIEISRS